MSLRGRVVITFYVHKRRRITDVTVVRPSTSTRSIIAARNALLASNPDSRCLRAPADKAFFTVTFYYNESAATADAFAARLVSARRLVSHRADERIASCRARRARADRHGQEQLAGMALAERLGGEIVNCDSTAVYPGFDIGTDKVPEAERRGIPHHLIDRRRADRLHGGGFARDAAAVIATCTRAGGADLVGGTGFYFRALTRGLFPGPARTSALRAAGRAGRRRAASSACGMVRRVDPASAARIQPRDRKRLVRALEVFFQTGRPLTAHFAETVSPLADLRGRRAGLRLPRPRRRVGSRARRRAVRRGLVDEVRAILAAGRPRRRLDRSAVSSTGRCSSTCRGVRDEAATRALIVQENRRYARRQLIWFRKEPNPYLV